MKKKLVKVSNYAHATGLSAVHVYRLIKQGKVRSNQKILMELYLL